MLCLRVLSAVHAFFCVCHSALTVPCSTACQLNQADSVSIIAGGVTTILDRTPASQPQQAAAAAAAARAAGIASLAGSRPAQNPAAAAANATAAATAAASAPRATAAAPPGGTNRPTGMIYPHLSCVAAFQAGSSMFRYQLGMLLPEH